MHKDGALAQLGIQEGLLEDVEPSCIFKDESELVPSKAQEEK